MVRLNLAGSKVLTGCPTHFADLVAGELTGLQTGVIWTAICVDYPGHSFEHLGLYFGESSLDGTESVLG